MKTRTEAEIVNLSIVLLKAFVVPFDSSVGCIGNYELSLLILCFFRVFSIPYFLTFFYTQDNLIQHCGDCL